MKNFIINSIDNLFSVVSYLKSILFVGYMVAAAIVKKIFDVRIRFTMYDAFTQSVINIIKRIPKGKVISYGMIANLAGNPRGARQVSWILHSMSEKHNLPWWRIINSKGIIALRPGEGRDFQRAKLEQEGIKFTGDYRIDIDSGMMKI